METRFGSQAWAQLGSFQRHVQEANYGCAVKASFEIVSNLIVYFQETSAVKLQVCGVSLLDILLLMLTKAHVAE